MRTYKKKRRKRPLAGVMKLRKTPEEIKKIKRKEYVKKKLFLKSFDSRGLSNKQKDDFDFVEENVTISNKKGTNFLRGGVKRKLLEIRQPEIKKRKIEEIKERNIEIIFEKKKKKKRKKQSPFPNAILSSFQKEGNNNKDEDLDDDKEEIDGKSTSEKKKKKKKKKKKSDFFSKKLLRYESSSSSTTSSSSDEEKSRNSRQKILPFMRKKRRKVYYQKSPSRNSKSRNNNKPKKQIVEEIDGDTQFRIENIEYILESLEKPKKKTFRETCSSLNDLTKLVHKEKDFQGFVRGQGLLQKLLNVLLNVLEVQPKTDPPQPNWISLLSLQLISFLLRDTFNCKFITVEILQALLDSLACHPRLEMIQSSQIRRTSRPRTAHYAVEEMGKGENERKIREMREQTVSILLRTILRVLKNVPMGMDVVMRSGVELSKTLISLIQIFVLGLSEKYDEEKYNSSSLDLNHSLLLLKFTDFEIKDVTGILLPPLVRALRCFSHPKRKRLYELETGHPVLNCVFAILNMLTNLTNYNAEAGSAVAFESGIQACLELIGGNLGFSRKTWNIIGYHFNITLNLLGLVTNLTEGNKSNRDILGEARIELKNGDRVHVFSYFSELYRLDDTNVVNLEREKIRKVKAYACVVIGCCCRNHRTNRKKILRYTKEKSFQGIIKILTEFRDTQKKNKKFSEEIDSLITNLSV